MAQQKIEEKGAATGSARAGVFGGHNRGAD